MTKQELVEKIAQEKGIPKMEVAVVVEALMETVKDKMTSGKNVYLRGFGSFVVKRRAEKTGRNITKNTTVIIPEHNIPAFKPSESFVNDVRKKVPVSRKD